MIRIFLKVIVALLLLILVAIALLPTIASTPWGRGKVVEMVNRIIPGSVEVDKLSLSWFGKQRVEGFVLRDVDQNKILSFSSLYLDAPLWRLICCEHHIGQTRLEGFDAHIIEEQSGDTNLQKALFTAKKEAESHKEKKERSARSSITGNVDIIDGSISLERPQVPLIHLADINAHVALTSDGPLVAELAGTTRQGDQQGTFRVVLNLAQDSSAIQSLRGKDGQMYVQVNVVNLPVGILAQLAAMHQPELSPFLPELLGNDISFSIEQTITDAQTQFEFKGHSSHFEADFTGVLSDNQIVLSRVGSMRLILTPTLMNNWLHKKKWLLDYNIADEIEATLTLNQLSIPLIVERKPDPFDLILLALKGNATLSPLVLTAADGLEQITIAHLRAAVESPLHSKELSFKVTGALIENDQQAPIAASGKIDAVTGIDVLIEVNQLPVILVDQMIKRSKGYVVEALGEHANLSVHASSREEGLLVAVQVEADRLTIPFTKFHVADTLTLVEPTVIFYHMMPQFLTRLLPGVAALKISDSIPITLSLQHFSMPLGKKEFDPQEIFVEADFLAREVQITGIEGLGRTHLQNFQIRLSGASLAHAQCVFNGTIDLLDKTAIPILWGPHTTFSGNAAVKFDFAAEPQLRLNNITALIESAHSRISLKGVLDGKSFATTAPAEWHYILLPEVIAALPLMQERHLELLSPTTIKTTIEPFYINFSPFDLSTLRLKGNAHMDTLAVRGNEYDLNTSIRNMEMPWELNGPDNVIHFETIAKILINPTIVKEGMFDADFLIGPWHDQGVVVLPQAMVKGKANITAFPVAVIAAATGFPQLEVLIGKTINAHIAAHFGDPNAAVNDLNVTLIGDQFQWSGIFGVENKSIALKNREIPSTARWTITPERFATLRKMVKSPTSKEPDLLALADKAEVRLKITDLKLVDYSYRHAALEADLTCDKLYFKENASKKQPVYGPIALHIKSADLTSQINLTAHIEETSPSQKVPSRIDATATLQRLFTAEGKFNSQGAIFTAHAKGTQLPVAFLCHTACLAQETQEQLDALIGKQLDVDLHLRLQAKNGPISFEVTGENGHLSADTQLTNNVVTLLKPLEAQLTVSPQFSYTILEKIVPFLKSAISSDKPVTLTIRPQGFAIPLDDLNILTVQAPKITIDLGKIRFSNKGKVADVIELLSNDKKGAAQQTIWFTPLYIGIENGVVSIERLDMLLDERFPIAMWGQVNFRKDKVDLKIGLPAETLNRSLGITGLSHNYMLVLPLKGTLASASIDKTKATARISALIAQAKGGPGHIIGGVLDLLSGGFKEEHIPQPTTNPLPWRTAD